MITAHKHTSNSPIPPAFGRARRRTRSWKRSGNVLTGNRVRASKYGKIAFGSATIGNVTAGGNYFTARLVARLRPGRWRSSSPASPSPTRLREDTHNSCTSLAPSSLRLQPHASRRSRSTGIFDPPWDRPSARRTGSRNDRGIAQTRHPRNSGLSAFVRVPVGRHR